MSGPNHHHIPRFLQRCFGASPKGRQKEIWQHTKGAPAELCLISETAADDHFYSASLDEKITKAEDGLAKLYHKMRVQPIGSPVDADAAAALVSHLAPRSSHLRFSFADGMRKLATGAHEMFTDPEQIEQLLGLHEDEPTEQFRDKLGGALRDMPQVEQAGLPAPVLERVAFYVAKESFDTTVGEMASFAGRALNYLNDGSDDMARDGHIRALDEMDDGSNVRRDLLSTFQWTVEAGPPVGAILPDCVALSYAAAEAPLPTMFAGKEMDVVVMPLTKNRLLVGRRDGADIFDVQAYNKDAASCSQTFFLTHADCLDFSALHSTIGSRCEAYFTEVMADVFKSVLPHHVEASEDHPGPWHLPREQDLQFACSISCVDFGDQTLCQRINDAAAAIIRSMAAGLPLSRLDSIIFAVDFPTALRSVDRGSAELYPIEAVNSGEVGCVGRLVPVRRDGRVKACIAFNVHVAACLIDDDEEMRATGVMMMVHELAQVAMIELVDRALPGAFEEPIDDELQAGLFSYVRDTLSGYVASRLSAGFGNAAEAVVYHRDCLIAALDAMKPDIEAERWSYRHHGDLDRLLSVALPAVGRVLSAASNLLGLCAGADLPVMDEDGALKAALERAALPLWLPTYARDLEQFFFRLGGWRSIKELLAFNRHVERLLWSVGLFPWSSPEGGRIEVPYFTDAQALLAELSETAR